MLSRVLVKQQTDEQDGLGADERNRDGVASFRFLFFI